MIATFEKMVFDVNDRMHHAGLLATDQYISPFLYIASDLFAVVMMIGFYEIVIRSDWYEKYKEFLLNTIVLKIILPLEIFILFLFALYLEVYDQILFFVLAIDIILIITIRKEFAGLRQWLDKNFGWLF